MLDPARVQAFVISLPAADVRREHIFGCLEGRIQARWIVAENGRAWSPEEVRRYCPDPYCVAQGRLLQPAEVACSVSHLKALKAFLQTDARNALILEDDATVTPEALHQIGAILDTLPSMDLLRLCGVGSAHIGRGTVHGVVDGVTVLRVLALGEHTHGYVVSRAGAQKLVNTILPVRAPYDIFWRNSWTTGCDIYESSPWLVWLTDEALHSTIESSAGRERHSVDLAHLVPYLLYKIGGSYHRRRDRARRFGGARLISGLPSGAAPAPQS